jgi:hypothetical protein
MLKQWFQSDDSEKSPPPLSGGDCKALQKELVKSRAMTGILAERSEEKRASSDRFCGQLQIKKLGRRQLVAQTQQKPDAQKFAVNCTSGTMVH